MSFTFLPQAVPDVILIQPQVFGDARGGFLELYKRSEFEAAGITESFVQDNYSISARGVLRGIHYQLPPYAQGKLVSVTQGVVWDVWVDLRRSSPSFGTWGGAELSAENHTMLYVPPGFGHGFVVLSEIAHFMYKCSQEYSPEAERGVRWDDPELAIGWPERDVIVSERDATLPWLPDTEVFEADV